MEFDIAPWNRTETETWNQKLKLEPELKLKLLEFETAETTETAKV